MEKKKVTNARGTVGSHAPVERVVASLLPTGTITFLFTDIEGSTPRWESHPDLMEIALKIHNDILFSVIQQKGGKVFKIVGDEFQAAFPTAPQALQAAIDIQLDLQNAEWNEQGPLKVRMGLHTGEAHPDDIGDEYAVSPTKNRVGRIRSAAYGGQILLSQESADLCQTSLPRGVRLNYLGEFRMKGLARREPLFQVVAPGLPKQFPPLATLADPKHNLPRQLTPFIGREPEIKQVKHLLTGNAMVTLTGSGGVGKTRLSIRVAEDLVEAFPDGVWFIELASLTDPKLVAQTVALTLGLREDAGLSFQEALLHFLKTRQVLLALDNCEHLIEACARLADSLLRQCPQLKLLASSREALGVAGEFVFHVPSLSIPDTLAQADLTSVMEYDALRLFVERGQAVLPSFHITPEDAPHIVRICERLDGIPLALELAAARLNVLSTEQLASRLDNTFRLLVGGARTAVPRQQTLRATIDWSYQLLSEQERRLLRRLAVFVGGWSLDGAEAVCAGEGLDGGDILDLLTSLVNKSIVIPDRVQGAQTRYHLLETVRQYGREKLFDAGESEALRDHHLAYYVRFADLAEPQIHGAGRLQWTAYLKTEHANLREALEWAFKDPSQAMLGLRIATAIADRFWFTLGYHQEEEHWLKSGLQITGENASRHLQARVYYNLGRIFSFSDSNQSRQAFKQCITLCREIGPEANRELALALAICAYLVDAETALIHSAEAVQVARSIAPADAWTLSETLYFQSDLLVLHGFEDQAYAAAQEFVQVGRSGDRWSPGGYWKLGYIQTRRNQFEQARENFEKGLELCFEVDDRVGIWYSFWYLGWHHRRAGQFHQAQVYYQELLKLYDRFRNNVHSFDLPSIGVLLVTSQAETDSAPIPPQWLDAVRLFAAFEIWKERNYWKGYFYDQEDCQDALNLLRKKLEPATFESAWEEGRLYSDSLDEAIKYAQSLVEKYNFQDRHEVGMGG